MHQEINIKTQDEAGLHLLRETICQNQRVVNDLALSVV